MQDVESELGMTRDKLIQLALLLGSDYTEGVAGIGIVNAVEIVNAFPTEELLVNFRYNADAACHLCCLQLVLWQDILRRRRTGCIREDIKQCCNLSVSDRFTNSKSNDFLRECFSHRKSIVST